MRRESELPWLQRQVRAFAERAGLSPADGYAVALAASEAATNMLKYAGGGRLTLRAGEGPPVSVEFVAADRGPGIPDIALATQDGVSEGVHASETLWPVRRRGRGTGLGSIQRLMTEVELESSPGAGTVLRARKIAGR